jgi:2-keto-4-pentenoate hydratase/2-oxohepta-3-ene-1,7-dioic acid hydratase in catechol pathway
VCAIVILLSAVTSEGPLLSVKTGLGVCILKEALGLIPQADNAALPETLDEAVSNPDLLERVGSYVARVMSEDRHWQSLLHPEHQVTVALPFLPRSIICVGLNYSDHATEAGIKAPNEPLLFAKLPRSVVGPGGHILMTGESEALDYEAELAVVIGRRCRRVASHEALKCVAGYMCLNDVSARDFQRKDGQWLRAKSMDTFAPIGPYLVTADEIDNPQGLAIRCLVNGEVRQNSNTSKMVFSVSELISFISRFITLEPGDVISTGTPHGVGSCRKPPVFLKDGDEVVVEIERVGRLSNVVSREN